MAKRLTSLGYTGYRHIRDAASWAAIAPEDQVDLRERMAADFEDSSLRDGLVVLQGDGRTDERPGGSVVL